MTNSPSNDRQIVGIMECGLSLAFGGLLASLQSLHRTPRGYACELSAWTFVTLLAGSILMFPLFKILIQSSDRKKRRVALTLIIFTGALGFFYPLRFVPQSKMPEVFAGLITAVFALGGIAFTMLKIHRYLSRDAEENSQVKPGH